MNSTSNTLPEDDDVVAPEAAAARAIAPASSWLRFTLVVLATAALALGFVAAVNAYVDPPQAAQPTARSGGKVVDTSGKVQLLVRQSNLDFVILGPSSVQKWDPRVVREATGARGFNAGVVGQPLADTATIVEWLAQRADADGEPMPHIVYGLAVEAFGTQPRGDRDLGLPGIEPDPSWLDRARSHLDRAGALIQYRNFKRSVQRIADRGLAGARHREPSKHPEIPPEIRADGYLTKGVFIGGGDLPPFTDLHQAVQHQHFAFYDELLDPTEVNADARAAFERMLRSANDAGDTPTVVLLPMGSLLAKLLGPVGREQYQRAVDVYLAHLAGSYEFTLLDYRDLDRFGMTDRELTDDVHPSKRLADAMLRQLVRDDPLLTR